MTIRGRVTAAAVAIGLTAAGRAAAQADSTLAAACAGGYGIADGLLLVEFRADLAGEQRSTLVKEAGATFVGPAPEGGPPGDYVVVPGASGPALDAAADRLIRLDGVQSVGGVTCPAAPQLPAADTTRPDTTARPDSAARGVAPIGVPGAVLPADSAPMTAPAPDSAVVPPADSAAVPPPQGP